MIINSAVSASDNSEFFPHFLEFWKRVKPASLLRGQYTIIDVGGIALTIINARVFQIWSATAGNEDLAEGLKLLRNGERF